METIKKKTLYWDAPDWGRFSITADSSGLVSLGLNIRENFQQCLPFLAPDDDLCSVNPNDGMHWQTVQQIKEYLSGERQEFSLPISFSDTQGILAVVCSIGYGQIVTYAEIANKLETLWDIKRIVTTLSKNPLPLIIPCHRIVKSSHDIGNYIWGLKIKQRLLRLETINKNKVGTESDQIQEQ